MTRLAVLAAAAVAAFVFPATATAGTERCCFLVDARVSGRLSLAAGTDLEAPGASAYRARWRSRLRHVARYVEHGRIFNALTTSGSMPNRELSVQLSEERIGLHAPTCRRTVRRESAGASEQAYVSLEDTTEGHMALVVRGGHPALRARCSPELAIPTAYVLPAPAGVVLRRARSLSLAWRDLIRLEDGPVLGSVEIRVRLSVVSPTLIAAAVRRGRRA